MIVKIALIQMKVVGGDKSENIRHAIELIEEAATNGANMAVLPECMDLGWTDESCLKEAEPIPNGIAINRLMQAAKSNSIYLCSGLTEREGHNIYNAAVLIDKRGKLIGKHRKINELEIAHHLYSQGNSLNVYHTEYGKIGLMICADGFANSYTLSKSLCYMGAEIILSPSSWAVQKNHSNIEEPYGDLWRDAYIPVAREFSTCIIGVSNVGTINSGPWKDRRCIGCSLAISNTGEEIEQGPYGIEAESIIYIEHQSVPKKVWGTGWENLLTNNS